MQTLKCPVCGNLLHQQDRLLRCPKGHSFDIAKQGYVNLLMSNKSSQKRHGDDKAMVLARQAFLDKGYYKPLRTAIIDAALQHTGQSAHLLDVGCGEGWYTCGIKEALQSAGKVCEATGIDISREALIQAAKRDKSLTLAVASVGALPLPDCSIDLIVNIFAPCDDAEFLRVLRPGGVVIRAVPLEDHLMGLKSAVYDTPYLNSSPVYAPEGFAQADRIEVRYDITLPCQEDIHQLFLMTPYYYKTSRRDQQKLETMCELTTNLSFCVFVMKKES